MQKEPKITLLILNWNRKEDTLKCLASLQGLNYHNYELVMIDNGSTDGSSQAIRKSFPDVKIIRNSENLGFSQGNNIGIEYALKKGTDYICLLNNDTVADKDFLLPLIQISQKDDRIGILGSRIYFYQHPRLIWSEGIRVNGQTGRVTTPYHRKLESEVGKGIKEWDGVSGAALLIKKTVIEEIGELDPDFFMYYEDVDWCLRTRKQGFRVVTVPTSRVWHKVSLSLGEGTSPIIIYYLIRNQLLFTNKNLPLSFRPRRWLRDLEIIAFKLAWLLTQPQIANREGLAMLGKGVKHYYQQKFGPMR